MFARLAKDKDCAGRIIIRVDQKIYMFCFHTLHAEFAARITSYMMLEKLKKPPN
jgi:hypothetical protein